MIKKVTLKPCDISLGEEIKNKVLGKLIFKYPKLAKFIDKTANFWAFILVVLSVWSLIYAGLAGLNLWVYDTCTPETGESCSLSGEACGIASNTLTFEQAVETQKWGEYLTQPFTELNKTISRIPERFKNWEAKDYLTVKPTYYNSYDSNKSTAVEFIDPGCKYCKQLFLNIKEAKFENKYNLTYVVYPIPDKKTSSGYKFQSSYQIASYMEALKDFPEKDGRSADWVLLEKIFTGSDEKGPLQDQFNFSYSGAEIPSKIEKIIAEMGYTTTEIEQIRSKANSDEVKSRLNRNKDIVEKELQTKRIPTIVFNGRRYDRVVDASKLN
ncbi:MAG: hypothetical protein OHK0017_00890 [Patescibacteria group bacterium]